MNKVREIYTAMSNDDDESRKAIVDEFIKQVGLSKAAANTYYQMIKKKSSTSWQQTRCFNQLSNRYLPE
jgi:hypothetical protein